MVAGIDTPLHQSEDDQQILPNAMQQQGQLQQQRQQQQQSLAKLLDLKIQDMEGSCDMKFSICLEGLLLTHGQFCFYEPEIFPGLIYQMVKPRIMVFIFVSGKVVFTGARAQEEIYEALDYIYPILKRFKKQ